MEYDVLLPDSQGDDVGLPDWIEGNTRWTSEGRESVEGITEYRSFSRIVDGTELFEVSVESFVFWDKYIVQVECLREMPGGERLCRARLLFRPRQTQQLERPYHGVSELINSNITIEGSLELIQGMVRGSLVPMKGLV